VQGIAKSAGVDIKIYLSNFVIPGTEESREKKKLDSASSAE